MVNLQLYDAQLTRQGTIEDVLSHRTGLEGGSLLAYRGDFGRQELLRRLHLIEPRRPLRTQWGYSNLMFIATGQVLEAVSGQSWQEFIQRRIFAPMKMNRSFTSHDELQRMENVATHYHRVEGRLVPDPTYADTEGWRRFRETSAPAGQIYSSAADLARFLQLHLADGRINGTQLLQAKTIGRMQTVRSHYPVSGSRSKQPFPRHLWACGLGRNLRDYRGRIVVMHDGSTGADVAIMPSENLGVVVLSNSTGSGIAPMVMHDVFDRFLGFHRPWTTRQWVAATVEEPQRELKKQRVKLRARIAQQVGQEKPLALRQYAGGYDCALYGGMEIRREQDDILSIHFGPNLSADLTHWHGHIFHAMFAVPHFSDWLIEFVVSDGGKVTGANIELPFENETIPPFDRLSAQQETTARRETTGRRHTITISVGMKWVRIPAGEFLMGSGKVDGFAREDEKPQHRVRISEPFYIGVHEVTAGQFRAFVEAKAYGGRLAGRLFDEEDSVLARHGDIHLLKV